MSHHLHHRSRYTLASALALIAGLAFVPSASASTYYWDADGTTTGFTTSATGTWGSSAFWSTDSTGKTVGANTTILSTDDVNFGSATSGFSTTASTVTISGTQSVNSITFGAGNTAQLNINGGTSLTLGSSSTITNNSGSNLSVNTLIAGTGGFTKSGSGTVILGNSSNSLSGTVTVSAGTLQLNGLSLQSADVKINTGTTVALGGTTSGLGVKTITFNGGTLQYNNSTTASTDYSSAFSTSDNQSFKINTNTQSTTFATALVSSGGTLTKSGTGTLTLSASNSFSGGSTVSAGTLATSATGNFGAGDVTVAAGAALTLGNFTSILDTAKLTFGSTSTINLGSTAGIETVGSLFNSVTSTFLTDTTKSYTASELNAFFGNITAFTGSGSIQISAIPEPAMLGTLAGFACLVGTVFHRRRQRRVG